jgi:hypothetical protein
MEYLLDSCNFPFSFYGVRVNMTSSLNISQYYLFLFVSLIGFFMLNDGTIDNDFNYEYFTILLFLFVSLIRFFTLNGGTIQTINLSIKANYFIRYYQHLTAYLTDLFIINK